MAFGSASGGASSSRRASGGVSPSGREPERRTATREGYADSRRSIAPTRRSSAWRGSTSGRQTRSRTEQTSAAEPRAILMWLRREAPVSAIPSAMLSTTDCEARIA